MKYYTINEEENLNIITREGLENMYEVSDDKWMKAINIGDSNWLDDQMSTPIGYTIPVELTEREVLTAIYNMIEMTARTFKDVSDVMASVEYCEFIKYNLVGTYEWLKTLAVKQNKDLILYVSFVEEHEVLKFRVAIGDTIIATYVSFITDNKIH